MEQHLELCQVLSVQSPIRTIVVGSAVGKHGHDLFGNAWVIRLSQTIPVTRGSNVNTPDPRDVELCLHRGTALQKASHFMLLALRCTNVVLIWDEMEYEWDTHGYVNQNVKMWNQQQQAKIMGIT